MTLSDRETYTGIDLWYRLILRFSNNINILTNRRHIFQEFRRLRYEIRTKQISEKDLRLMENSENGKDRRLLSS